VAIAAKMAAATAPTDFRSAGNKPAKVIHPYLRPLVKQKVSHELLRRLLKAFACLFFLAIIPLYSEVQPTSAKTIVTDDLGRQITLIRPVRRIISLAPSVTEILYAVGAQDKLVGDTAYCDYPPAARNIAHVGNMLNPSDEKIISLRPDFIIIASQTIAVEEADQLQRRWHCPVYVTAAADYAGVEHNIAALGNIAGTPAATHTAIRQMQQALQQVQITVRGKPKPSVFVVVWERPLMTAGGKSFIGDLIRLAGGTNVAENLTAYPSYSLENLLRQNPEIILMDGHENKVTTETLTIPGSAYLKAVRLHHIYGIPSDWIDRPGPRLRFALLAVAKVLHSDKYRKGFTK
jgi:iron complex transport system substrate-binding protein